MEKKTFYLTLEVQVDAEGNRGILHNVHDERPQAESAFYGILQAASISAIPYHAAYLIQDNGMIIGSKVFDRRVVPQPEPMEVEAVETTETTEEG